MLLKLQKNTLIRSQLVGYFFTLCIGVVILLTVIQLYFDAKPIIQEQTDVFSSNYAVVNKNISIFKTFDKQKIYFSDEEMKDIENQSFVEKVSPFNTATFKIGAYTDPSQNMPMFHTDLFFESIPNSYLDVQLQDWKWAPDTDFLPIIIPETYLSLYNFGFAQSQGLPVFSKNMISKVGFGVTISGNGKSKNYQSRIVGFSSKINSILVPEDFLLWANETFGRERIGEKSRLLVAFKNPSDERILAYFNEHNYTINKEALELGKLHFFFKSAMFIVGAIGLIIIVLSMGVVVLSLNVVLQKNKEQLRNLYLLGYSVGRIARFYQVSISVITLLGIFVSIFVSIFIRGLYLESVKKFFDITQNSDIFLLWGVILGILLISLYNLLVFKSIQKITRF